MPILPLLLLPQVQAVQVPGELLALGAVRPFQWPEIPLPMGDYRDNSIGGPVISDDGKFVYRLNGLVIVYWKIGASRGGYVDVQPWYNRTLHRPIEDNDGTNFERHSISKLPVASELGLVDGTRPYSYSSDMGWDGVIATTFTVLDVWADMPGRRRILYFERRKREFVGYDVPRKLLYLADREPPNAVHAYRLGKTYRDAREVPVPPALKPLFRRKNRVLWTVEGQFRYAFSRAGEHDLVTGKLFPYPHDVPPTDKHFLDRRWSLEYVGEDLFFTTRPDSDGRTLYRWDRKARRSTSVGGYHIMGSSPNGRYMIVRSMSKDHRDFFIDRGPRKAERAE